MTGPDLGLADALATALAVAGEEGLAFVEATPAYEGLVIGYDGSWHATPGFPFHPLGNPKMCIRDRAWAATAGLVVTYRFVVPLLRSARHQLRIERVKQEAPGVYSVICRGRRVDRLAVSGGQFFQWRFLAEGLWWQAHPYSLSALPRPPMVLSLIHI